MGKRVHLYSGPDARRAAELLMMLKQAAVSLNEYDRPPAEGEWKKCRPADVKARYGREHNLGTTTLDTAVKLLHVVGAISPTGISGDRHLYYVRIDFMPADEGHLMRLAGGLAVSSNAPDITHASMTFDPNALASSAVAAANRIRELTQEVARLKGVVSELLGDVDRLKADLASATADAAYYEELAHALDRQIDEVLKENGTLGTDVTNLEQTVCDLTEALQNAGVRLVIGSSVE